MKANHVGSPGRSRLRSTANRIYNRMEALGLNETELSEQCSLAAIHIFEDDDPPVLTRDRVSKILMNRQDVPAKSAARIISQAELMVLSNVLQVSIEWLTGQEGNRDPVVWNALANPDRATTFCHLLQEYELLSDEAMVWSRYPMHWYGSEAFAHAFNQVHYGGKPGVANRALAEFHNRVARLRRKWILRPDRSFEYSNLVFQSDFETATCGTGIYSAISKGIRRRNLEEVIEVIGNPSLRLRLIILQDETHVKNAFRDYEILATMDSNLSVWNYHNGDIGWSEHPNYVQPHRHLLDRLMSRALYRDVDETIQYIESLKT